MQWRRWVLSCASKGLALASSAWKQQLFPQLFSFFDSIPLLDSMQSPGSGCLERIIQSIQWGTRRDFNSWADDSCSRLQFSRRSFISLFQGNLSLSSSLQDTWNRQQVPQGQSNQVLFFRIPVQTFCGKGLWKTGPDSISPDAGTIYPTSNSRKSNGHLENSSRASSEPLDSPATEGSTKIQDSKRQFQVTEHTFQVKPQRSLHSKAGFWGVRWKRRWNGSRQWPWYWSFLLVKIQ